MVSPTARDVLEMLTDDLEYPPTNIAGDDDKATGILWWDGADYKITLEFQGDSSFQR